MPKYLLGIILFLFLLLASVATVRADYATLRSFYDWGPWYNAQSGRVLAEATGSATASATPSDNPPSGGQATATAAPQAEVKKPSGLLPDHPLYFIKPLSENINLTFTFDPKTKEKKRLTLSEERLAETKDLIEKKKFGLASKNFNRYKTSLDVLSKNLETLKNRQLTLEDLAKLVEQDTAKHSLVLEKLDLLVPDELKDEIEDALNASERGMDVSADVLGRDSVPADLRERLESLKALGIIPESEVSAVFTLKSRGEVRKEIERLAQQNILPEADIKRLDEAQYGYFPADFIRVSEVKKLYEFRRLEELKPDTETQKKIAEFAAVYRPGEPIPPDLKRWWVPLQRYQELSATLRPDLVINSILPKDGEEYKKFENIFNKFKPSEDQLRAVDKWVKDHPGQTPPPEVQRVASLAVNLGSPTAWKPPENIRQFINTGFPTFFPPPSGFARTADCKTDTECKELCEKNPANCGPGFTPPKPGGSPLASVAHQYPAYPGGYPGSYPGAGSSGFGGSFGTTSVPGAPSSYCLQTETKAKNAFTGEIKLFPNSCLPVSWYPYFGPEKPGEVSRPAFIPFQPPTGGTGTICDGGRYRDLTGQCRCPDGMNFTNGYCQGTPTGSTSTSTPPSGSTFCSLPNANGYKGTDGVCRIQNCFSGWSNNDSHHDNGCEYSSTGTSPTTSPTPTSSTTCFLSNANTTKWADGSCHISSCFSGWTNSDGQDANGCETSSSSSTTTTPTSSPTTTTTSCPLPNANGTKGSDGVCRVSSCFSGWTNSDGQDANGCETSTTSSPSPSASTSPLPSPCSLANASSTRGADGICHISSCNSGWYNNDGSDSNGCESSVAPGSGGGTGGTTCPLPYATGYRSPNGMCHIQSCNPGWYNKNLNDLDGCESPYP